jgi:NADPH:quinone reductase-like Zn-dependent oxidoreductase
LPDRGSGLTGKQRDILEALELAEPKEPVPMKAVVCRGYGPPERLEFREVERPTPSANEVLVGVHATSVNRTDVATLRGTPFFARLATGVRRPRHPILGSEFAGRVEAVGSQVSDLAVGDEVFGFSGATFGAHAEYLVVPADGPVATIPAGLSYHEVASSTEGPHYALSSIEAADLGAGDQVLVYGATGAIGTAAVQLLTHRGATVTAVCDPHGTDLVASLGAAVVIDRSREDFARTVSRFDAILDAVGQTTLRRCRHLLKPGAPYLSTDLGPGWQNLALIPLTRFIGDHRVLIPFPRDVRRHVHEVRGLLAGGAFRPVVDRTYPLEGIVEAYRYVQSRQKLGTVVVTVT